MEALSDDAEPPMITSETKSAVALDLLQEARQLEERIPDIVADENVNLRQAGSATQIPRSGGRRGRGGAFRLALTG
jgi:hypothetical protein